MLTLVGVIFASTLLGSGFVTPFLTQDPVVEKPLQQWTRDDAKRILTDSPWAIRQEVRIRYAGQSRPVAGGAPQPAPGDSNRNEQNSINSAGAESPVDFLFTLRLRSAMPVRKALVRMKQLDAKYDQMKEEERAGFDAKTKGLLECPPCAENYVLTLSSRSNQNPGADAVFSVFKGARLPDLQRYVFIADEQGNRRPLVHFIPPRAPGDEAIFYFARFDEKGAPLLSPNSRELRFNLTNNEVNVITNFRIDVSRVLIDGEVAF